MTTNEYWNRKRKIKKKNYGKNLRLKSLKKKPGKD
jgi:hypothetical protein